jgi:hypothetical protein
MADAQGHIMKRRVPSDCFLPIVLTFLVAAIGCSPSSHPRGESTLHIVNVAHDVEPRQILAGRGDEIRWRNTGTQPILVNFPASIANRLSCRVGFNVEEPTALTARIDANASASLCFAQQGKYNYQVRVNDAIAGPLIDHRAIIWIVGRGERNPDPYEEYTNITP